MFVTFVTGFLKYNSHRGEQARGFPSPCINTTCCRLEFTDTRRNCSLFAVTSERLRNYCEIFRHPKILSSPARYPLWCHRWFLFCSFVIILNSFSVTIFCYPLSKAIFYKLLLANRQCTVQIIRWVAAEALVCCKSQLLTTFCCFTHILVLYFKYKLKVFKCVPYKYLLRNTLLCCVFLGVKANFHHSQ
jgi:hypothetical protein